MAIHFNYIKGLNGDVTKLSTDTTTSDSDDLYTFIKWASRGSGASISQSTDYTPEIHINKVNSLNGATSLGHIITSNAINQGFYVDTYRFNASSTWFIPGGKKGGPYWGKIFFNGNSSQGSVGFQIETGANLFINSAGSLTVSEGNANTSFIVNKKESFFNGKIKVNSDADVNTYVEISEGNIEAKGHIDSLFFNATSDKRAKENIQPATYNAIELIKKLQVYTYNYKNKTETVTGILAQDLLEAQPEGLDLVSNVNATGENGDYMSIKNDKLVFILMKAIQEQQEQIEKLQEELNKLKESQ